MNMKKNIGAFFLAFAILLSCGCGKQDTPEAGAKIDAFVYDSCKNVQRMAAEGDTLYTLNAGENDEAVLSAFDANGDQTANTVIDGCTFAGVQCICAEENNIYAAIRRSSKKSLLCSADINGSSRKTICELDKLDDIEKISVQDGKLYWLGRCQSEAKYVDPFIDKEGNIVYFSDSGKKLGCVDLESGENVVSEIEFPVSFSASNGKVTVYAFDEAGGYYFADYAAPSEKKYTNKLGLINNFEFYGENGEFAFVGSNQFIGVLPVSRADGESGVAKAAGGVYSFYASELCASESGFVWLSAADSASSAERQIKRYDLKDFVLTGNPVRIISSQYFDQLPFASGSEIQLNQLSDEGFALTVLSLDKSYDAALVSSEQVFANEIKEKGSFYPLNELDGVSEYLDSCFPYIREAVTDSEGNICMLPLRVDMPLIIYNEKNCADNGVTFPDDLETFLQSIKQASNLSGYLSDCSRYWMVQTQLSGYLSSGKSFDTEEFRKLAVLLKEQCTEDIFMTNFDLYSALMTMQYVMGESYYSSIYEKTLFTQLRYYFQEVQLINDKNLRAAPMPVPESGKNIAVCAFLCVNPYSDRLSETLAYIENIVSTMSAQRNSYMLSDKGTYESSALAQDLYSIYENGEIYFQIPTEIYWEDFDRYCNDELSLDEFINEADRKLSAYLNE